MLYDKLDRVVYKGVTLTNILRRIKPIKEVLDRIDVYHEYEIHEGERADSLAFDYYGDSNYTWLIYVANGIYDPYYQWPLTSNQFFRYMKRKYTDPYQAQIDIRHYENVDMDFIVSPYTFQNWTIEEQAGWLPITYWQYEDRMNEGKRKIKLVSKNQLEKVKQEVEEFFR